ncbi:HDOD domain-containing protein [Roseateles sp.]|uniref:HDOD domain-containing protein n=1 Tax=Roseateles sp. TaxID=1971397 RepID=UPI00286C6858|nr:HDOD domain-containing protein [Roseateles sp.]
MNTLTMDLVLSKVNALPSLPALVLELLASIDQEDSNADALADKLSQDQALTAKTLRLANSSFYGMPHQVTSMQQSIAILGFRTIRSLATTAALIGAFPSAAGAGFDMGGFWRHAYATALFARELAPTLQVNPEQAYTAGLLHDIGLLVLVTQFTDHFAAVLAFQSQADQTPLLEAERATLGLDHARIGHALTSHWKFPEALQHAVTDHHQPAAPDEPALISLVRCAVALAVAISPAMDAAQPVPTEVLGICQAIGLDPAASEALVAKVKHHYEAASLLLAA